MFGWVQRGEHLRLALEPGETIRVAGEGVGENLERHLAVELGVGGLPHLTHAALAEQRGHVVAPYALESHLIRPETEGAVS